MPSAHILFSDNKNFTPERLRIGMWQNKQECLFMLNLYKTDGKDALINWMETEKNIQLDDVEKSRLSQLMANIRTKYKKELGL